MAAGSPVIMTVCIIKGSQFGLASPGGVGPGRITEGDQPDDLQRGRAGRRLTARTRYPARVNSSSFVVASGVIGATDAMTVGAPLTTRISRSWSIVVASAIFVAGSKGLK